MAAWLDNVRFTASAGGTTDWTFSAAVAGSQTPALGGAVNGRVYKFLAISGDKLQWEITEGAYNSTGAGSFARTTVLYNSAGTGTATGQSGAGTKINFTAAPDVAIIGAKEDLISIEEANSFTSTQQGQARSNIAAAPLASPVFTGTPTAPTPTANDNSQKLATTAFIASGAATTAKAWVLFNGTGTVAISSSFNVSSITDTATGDWTVNLSTAQTDANLCAVANCGSNASGAAYGSVGSSVGGTTLTASSVRFNGRNISGALTDGNFCSCVVYR